MSRNEIKTKINILDILKSLCSAKETINKMKRLLSEWEKIFANEAINMALISKTYKHFIELSIKIINNLIKY